MFAVDLVLRCFSFVFLSIAVGCCWAKIDPRTVGTPVDETFAYKTKRQPKSMADRDYDVLAALNRIDTMKSKAAGAGHSGASEVFTVSSVNGDDITNVDVLNTIKLLFFFSGKQYDKSVAKMMLPSVLQSLEDDKLRQQCADMFGVAIPAKDIDDRVADMARDNGMSVTELNRKFDEFGISMNVFRESIKSRIIFQIVARSYADDRKISKEELEEARNDELALLSSRRYRIAEIFREDAKSANEILQLLKNGFNFQILSENFSQKVYSGQGNGFRWAKAGTVEPEVLNILQRMSPGECSPVIKTKAGYKIVLLLDKAEPGKAGSSEASYKVLKCRFQYRSNFFTQQDAEKTNERLTKLLEIDTAEKFREFCNANSLECEKAVLYQPNGYDMELVNRARASGKAAALQALDDEECLNVILLVDESVPNAKLPSDERLREIASEKRMEKSFVRNFRRLKSSAHIDVKKKNVERIFR
ncbi:MAG: peptidylprolyl isomerase [Alphaproteobacteria bacterium]|nr:peptidylprolyl isomerase [Alphaproteobacteria bacterium]